MSSGEDEVGQLFAEAMKEWEELLESDLRCDDPLYFDKINDLQGKIREVGDQVNELSLFSANETLQDVATSSLPFIRVPYILGMMEQRKMQTRLQHLQLSKLYLGNFIQVCEMMGILCEADKEEAETAPTPGEKRARLIARAKREKEVNDKCKYLQERKAKMIADQGIDNYESSDLEEVEREMYLIQIQQAINNTFTEIRMIDSEIPMVHRMEEIKRNGPPKEEPEQPAREPKPPFTLTRNHRGELQAQVFRPHWVQHSMTIEEAADIDMQYMITGGGDQSKKKKVHHDDSDPDDDVKARKDRDWADWCDDNPSGSGNSMANLG